MILNQIAQEPIKIIQPQPGPQELFANCQADIAIYGGQAGGGKSWSLIFEPLKYMDMGNANASIFRRTFSDITNQGGLWDEAMQMYPEIGGKPNKANYSFTFDSGMQIKFCHLQSEDDKYNYKGAQIAIIMFDELTSFTESQFWYLMSRNRTKSNIKPYIRATTNPDATSWVKNLILWYLDDEGRYARPERSGVIRYFINKENELFWANSREELIERFPKEMPLSFTFIPASLDDNQALVSSDPMYRARLMNLSKVERERLLGGDWNIIDNEGVIGAFMTVQKFTAEYLVAFIDTSFSDALKSDRTSVSIVGFCLSHEYSEEFCPIEFTGKSWQKSISNPEVVNELVMFLDQYQPIESQLESQLSDSTQVFIDRLKQAEKDMNIRVKNNWTWLHQAKNKHEKIMTYVAGNKHRLRVVESTDKSYLNPVMNYSKKTRKDKDGHDDEPDSLAGAIDLWLTSKNLREYIYNYEMLKKQRAV